MRSSFLFSAIIAIVIVALLSHCEYKPKIEFDRGIHKPDSATVSISLSPYDTTYTLYESADLNFNLNTFGLPVYSVCFFMDEDMIYERTDTAGTIHLEYSTYYPGTYTLSMVVTTGTNTGSLADLLHSEGFVFSEKWKISFAHADPPVACQIIRITDTNGTVRISWNKYNGIAFKKYYISKASDLNGNIWDERTIRTVTDQGITSIFDSTCIGGTLYYRVEVVNSGGYAYSNYYVHATDKSNLKATWTGGNKIKLTWNPCIFSQNFKQYTISEESTTGDVIYSTDTIGITSYIYNGGVFGGTMKFSVRIYSKIPSYITYDDNNSSATVDVGDPFHPFEAFYNTSVNSVAYLLNEYKLTRLNLASGQNYGTVDLGYGTSWCAVSPNDNLIIAPTMYSSYQMIIPSNFFHVEIVALPNTYGPCMETTLSGFGLGMGHFEMPQNGYFIYDFLNKTQIFAKTTTNLNCGRISPDRNYILTGFSQGSAANCYRISNNDFEIQWTNPSTPYDLVPKTNSVVLINSSTSKVEVRDIESTQLLYTFTKGENENYQDTDPDNPLMLFSTPAPWNQKGSLKVYNYVTGTKVFEMSALNSGWASFAIQDSILYSGAGFRIKMQ